jgi:DNA-binding MarR family transcriptional regulator
MTGYKDELEQAKRQSVAQLLFRTSRILNEHAIARFRESTGLPLRVAHTRLFPLIDLEGTRLTELAKRLGVSKQATNQWVEELLQMGMLEKRADPTDRRARLICFSEQGQMGILAGLSFLKELEKEFSIPEGTKSTKLVYSTTGHGGGTADANCIGHADEFCKRSHRVFVDGKQAKLVIPWRNDCSNFCTEVSHPRNPSFKICKENPCGSKASVRAPRANWCPGTTTYPYTWSFPEWNAPGKHTFGYSVANVAKGGSWKTSVILYVYGE